MFVAPLELEISPWLFQRISRFLMVSLKVFRTKHHHSYSSRHFLGKTTSSPSFAYCSPSCVTWFSFASRTTGLAKDALLVVYFKGCIQRNGNKKHRHVCFKAIYYIKVSGIASGNSDKNDLSWHVKIWYLHMWRYQFLKNDVLTL